MLPTWCAVSWQWALTGNLNGSIILDTGLSGVSPCGEEAACIGLCGSMRWIGSQIEATTTLGLWLVGKKA